MEYIYKDVRIQFHKVAGDLYRVIIIIPGGETKRDWVNPASKYNPSASLARFFYKKHIEGKEDPSWLAKAEKKPEKHEPSSVKGFVDWLREEHPFEVVGTFGSWDTPVHRYIKETRDTWKKSSFLVGDVYEDRPRWMFRLANYCEEQHPGEVIGCYMASLLQSEQWNIRYYDNDKAYERMLSR